MLKRHATFFSTLRSITDIIVISSTWVAVYFVRFNMGIFASPKGVPDFTRHLILMLPILSICYLSCWWTGLYKPKRIHGIFKLFTETIKASILAGLGVLAFLYYIQDAPYSRKLLILFIITLFIGMFCSHILSIIILRLLREKGYNLRYCAVIGTGKSGQLLVQDIEYIGWLGMKCKFFVDNEPSHIGGKLLGIPIYGPIEKLPELVKDTGVDEVYLTLQGNEAQQVYPILKSLQSAGVTIRIVPDWGNLFSISDAGAIQIGSQLLFSAADSPLSGNNIILKEVFDRVVGFALLAIFAIPMAIIALLIKLTSEGPVFYKQSRMGMDQKEFQMLKFRTMTVNAEEKNGPQWTKPGDQRRTRIGAWLRSTSLDELPQLINVIKGEMSLVGPRPERPFFVKQFSEEYNKYMLRHKLKAGITGWAQIHDLRGETSLKKRLQYDLSYIRNWSLWLDLWILLQTPWHIIKGKNAY